MKLLIILSIILLAASCPDCPPPVICPDCPVCDTCDYSGYEDQIATLEAQKIALQNQLTECEAEVCPPCDTCDYSEYEAVRQALLDEINRLNALLAVKPDTVFMPGDTVVNWDTIIIPVPVPVPIPCPCDTTCPEVPPDTIPPDPEADFTVSTASELLAALPQAANKTISIQGTITGAFTIPANVTLKGGKLTGMVDVSGGWELYSGNIYRKPFSQNAMYLTINGQYMERGKWPDAFYPILVGGSNTLGDATHLTQGADFWNGAEVVVKNAAFWTEVKRITDFGSGTLTLASPVTYGTKAGNGYFIQNHPSCLNASGEWALWNGYLYLYHTSPNSQTIQASAYGTGLTLSSNVKVSGVTIEGFTRGILAGSGSQITDNTITRCADGIYAGTASGIYINNNTLTYIGNTGIDIRGSTRLTISRNKLTNIGTVLGYGSNGLKGIYTERTDSVNIFLNDFANTGYSAICVGIANDVRVEKNRARNYCMLNTDGGGIYFWNAAMAKIYNNFCEGGTPSNYMAPAGRNMSIGIYMDLNCTYFDVKYNLAVKNSENIYANPGHHINIEKNYTYGGVPFGSVASELYMDGRPGGVGLTNVTVIDNVFASVGSNYCLRLNAVSGNTFTGNYYWNQGTFGSMDGTMYTVASWAASHTGEQGSAYTGTFVYDYNFSPFPKQWEGQTLQPYTGLIIRK